MAAANPKARVYLAKKALRLFYAREDFTRVSLWCNEIIGKSIPPSSVLYYPLIVAIYTVYYRPFTDCEGIGKLSESIVPPKFLKLHNDIKKLRNELYAHANSEGTHAVTKHGYKLLAKKEIKWVSATGSTYYNVELSGNFIYPTHNQIQEIGVLAEELAGITKAQGDPALDEVGEEIENREGYFLLTLNENAGRYFRRAKTADEIAYCRKAFEFR